jgi:DNA modification methylase
MKQTINQSSEGDQSLIGKLSQNVVWEPITALIPNRRNARRHPREQLHRLQSCIKTHGFLIPILIDEKKNVIAGHARIEAAKRLAMKRVPTLTAIGLTPTQRRTLTIADNRIAEGAGWDNEALRKEIAELLDLQVDIEQTGFSTGEIDILIDGVETKGLPEDDVLPPVERDQLVSREGDIWELGPHRLGCSDARARQSYEALLGGGMADIIFTDPPYNVPIDGHVSGRGRVKHQEFTMASGEMSSEQFTAFLVSVCKQLVTYSRPGSIHFVCMDWRHLREILNATASKYKLKNMCVWNKDNAGMGSLYRSKHELVLVFQNGSGRSQNNVSLGATGRYRTNVWDYPGLNSLHRGRAESLALHPTVKPLALVADAIRDCSKRGDLVLDPFVGSGTTILAAHRTGRVCAALEIDPAYVDVAIRRWESITRIPAILSGSGQTFSRVREVRSVQAAAHCPGERT